MPAKPDEPIKILIVDDHSVVREGTREMLNRNPLFSVVGESPSGDELIGLLNLKQPDLLLLDINLPGKNGLQLLEELKPQFPKLKIILFSAHCEMPYIRKAQHLKADGFLSKTISETELQNAILETLNSQSEPVFSSDILEKIKEQTGANKGALLTAREQEILGQLVGGLTNQGIAKDLCLSVKTVDTHVANIMKKVGVNNRTQLLAFAYEHGLV